MQHFPYTYTQIVNRFGSMEVYTFLRETREYLDDKKKSSAGLSIWERSALLKIEQLLKPKS